MKGKWSRILDSGIFRFLAITWTLMIIILVFGMISLGTIKLQGEMTTAEALTLRDCGGLEIVASLEDIGQSQEIYRFIDERMGVLCYISWSGDLQCLSYGTANHIHWEIDKMCKGERE